MTFPRNTMGKFRKLNYGKKLADGDISYRILGFIFVVKIRLWATDLERSRPFRAVLPIVFSH